MTAELIPRRHNRTELLRSRNFMLLWFAYGISAMGDHLSEMAILKTQNATSVDVDVTPLDARMTFLFFVPFFLLAPFTGWLADRLPRRGLMIFADLARCLLLLSFVTLMQWTAPWGDWGAFVPLLFIGIFAAVFSPARSALLPTLIRPDQLVRANGMISGLGIIATMFAIKIGGYLADNYDPVFAFRIDAGTFILSAICLLFLRSPQQHGLSKVYSGIGEVLKEIADGFRYVLSHRRVRELIMVAALVWFCGPLVKCVIPAVVRDVYHGAYSEMSNYRLYLGIGFVLGAIGVTTLGDALRTEIAITWGFFGIAVSIAIFSISTFLPFETASLKFIGAFGVTGAGIFGVTVMTGLNAQLQRMVPSRYLGRVYGVKDVCCTAALLTATGALGIPEWTSVDRWVGWILLLVAACMGIAGAVTLSIRMRRSLHPPAVAFAMNLNHLLSKFWWRHQRIGRATLPREGPVIVTANHTCPADPLLISAAAPYRKLAFMVAAEYTTWPVFRWVMKLADCIPVKRDNQDTAATKQAIRYLRAGNAMGIFIEGRIVHEGEESQPRDGVAMLALRTGAKVIPVFIGGTVRHPGVIRGLFARHRARVYYGPPVDLSEFEGVKADRAMLREATYKIYVAIHKLAPVGDPNIAAFNAHLSTLTSTETTNESP